MGNPKFVIKRSDDQFHFHLTAANGEIILTSERYKTRSSAENGVMAVKESAAMERRYERRESRADEPYFVLKAGNNEIIGTSQMYVSKRGRDEGMRAVMENAGIAEVEA